MSTRVTLQGSLVLGPPCGTSGMSCSAPFSLASTYAHSEKHDFSGTYAHAAVSFAPITNVKMLYATADTPIDIELTHANGTDQHVRLDRLMLIDCPNAPITGIKLNGTSTGTILVAGD